MSFNLNILNKLVKMMNDMSVSAQEIKEKGLLTEANRSDYAAQMAMLSGLATAAQLESQALTSDAIQMLKIEGLQMQTIDQLKMNPQTKAKIDELFDPLKKEVKAEPNSKNLDKKLN